MGYDQFAWFRASGVRRPEYAHAHIQPPAPVITECPRRCYRHVSFSALRRRARSLLTSRSSPARPPLRCPRATRSRAQR
jgi:hypothetical protein